jgi:peptidoglycan-N-acetylglucosamine deacetylase
MADLYLSFLYASLFISLFFEVFLLITYLEVREQIKREDALVARGPQSFPSVTVIVPCFNEEKTVAATVKSILKLEYPREKLSLILVDDGSTDDTWQALQKFKGHPQIRVLSKANGGKHTAMNLALESVDTDLVGALDADSFVTPEALRKIVPYFDDATVMAVTPSIKVHEPKNVLQHIQKTEYSWSIFLRRMLSALGALYVTPGPFSIFRTKVFRELGGYKHAHMTEDMEMAMRMQKHRYKIVNSHGAHVYTVTPNTLGSLVKQRTRWSYGFLNNAIDYKALFFNKNYGHFGMFIMPIAIVSMFTSFAMVSRIAWNALSTMLDQVTRFRAVGFTWKVSTPSFDWFFINTGVLTIVVVTALILTGVILFLSFRLSDGKFKFTQGLFYYLFLYVFLTPLWLTKALFKTIFRRQISWR